MATGRSGPDTRRLPGVFDRFRDRTIQYGRMVAVRALAEIGRREAIGVVVADLIDELGLDLVSIRLVADRAGVSIGAVQHWFPTKDALLLHAHRQVSEAIAELADAAVVGVDDPRSALRAILLVMLPTNPTVARLLKVFVAFETRALHAHALNRQAVADNAELQAAVEELFRLAGVREARREAITGIALVGGLMGPLLRNDPCCSLADSIEVVDAHLARVFDR